MSLQSLEIKQNQEKLSKLIRKAFAYAFFIKIFQKIYKLSMTSGAFQKPRHFRKLLKLFEDFQWPFDEF